MVWPRRVLHVMPIMLHHSGRQIQIDNGDEERDTVSQGDKGERDRDQVCSHSARQRQRCNKGTEAET